MEGNLIIGGSSKVHKRSERDFYPTPEEVTVALLKKLDLPRHTVVWEPACGTGAMSSVLEKYFDTVVSTDVAEECYGTGNVNFITAGRLGDFVITNPPFIIADKFIEKCHSLDLKGYAILLKSTYWHAKSRSGLFARTNPSYIFPLTWRPNFAEERGKAPLMDMIWTVWLNDKPQATVYELLHKPAAKD